MKSLEVSEEKANQRVEEFKREMKTLTVKLKEAETRAEHAEKQVKRLQKEVDRLEGNINNSTQFEIFLNQSLGKMDAQNIFFPNHYCILNFTINISHFLIIS